MNKIAFIIPYFGKFNNYFSLFLESCGKNRNSCDWIIFTDDRANFVYPENVYVHYMEWVQMQEYIKTKFSFPILVETPYKLCDFKPAYGYIFEDYLRKYNFWGHCDIDLIWGDFEHFLSVIDITKYCKVFDLGHCTIFQNTSENNQLFRKTLNGKSRFEEVYRNNYNCSFDEEYHESINNIYLEHKKSIYTKSFAANTYTKSSNFILTRMDEVGKYVTEKKSDSFFIWDAGALYRLRKDKERIIKEEFLYIHFQSRPMKIRLDSSPVHIIYKIIPNSFEPLEIQKELINKNNFGMIRKKHFNLHYFRLRTKNLIIKLKRRYCAQNR